jgi:hypothetical protein
MNSSSDGIYISDCSVTNINALGMWLLVDEREYFIPFGDYPDFKDATIDQINHVNFLPPDQLHWPLLDIDIELQALEQPENYPLIFRL